MGVAEGGSVDAKLALASLSQGLGVSAGWRVNSDKLRSELYSGLNSGFRRSWLPVQNGGLLGDPPRSASSCPLEDDSWTSS